MTQPTPIYARPSLLGILLFAITFVFIPACVDAEKEEAPLRGFSRAGSERERAIEKQFMAVPQPNSARDEHARLTIEPHIAGSPADQRTAAYVAEKFRNAGISVEIETFQVMLSEPVSVKIDVLGPEKWSGPSGEYVASDPASWDKHVAVGFNAYSASGDVTGSVVYANYGLPEDYDTLRENGISAEGRIVIVRYGACYRGVKAQVAEEHKAAGLIIYSDPQEDGYHSGDAYPEGPWRPESGVQRGSVLYDYIYPGVKPGIENKPLIPVAPLSYGDARHILAQLRGPAAPRDWQGGLPFTYHMGAGPTQVRMQVKMEEKLRAVWNVIGKIPGTGTPEEWVITGNHRDAWTYGGVDPNSGTVALLEAARGFSVLLKSGWRPKRTIVLCSWDAEEPDELGSTAWTEKHERELTEKAAVYLNLDSAVAGDQFTAVSVPSLKPFLRELAADVPDPKGGSVLERANARLKASRRRNLAHAVLLTPGPPQGNETELQISDLGGGTDYVAFLNHLGIPSTDFVFEGNYGVYHSAFDNHLWMKKFGDPTFAYHVAAAQYLGLEILRLANAALLPFEYGQCGREIQAQIQQLDRRQASQGEAAPLDFSRAMAAAAELTRLGQELRRETEMRLMEDRSAEDWYPVNRELVAAERSLLLPEGLPNRPWYRHAIYAPGFRSGYEATVLPGVRESLDENNRAEAGRQLDSVTLQLQAASRNLREASVLLDRGKSARDASSELHREESYRHLRQ